MVTAVEMHIARRGAVLRMRDVKLQPPGAGEVQVSIEAAGVAYADVAMRAGVYPGVKMPVTPGYDFVGHVIAVGTGADGLRVGQRVAGVTVTGSYATHRNVAARLVVPAPEAAAAQELVAATLNGLTAWQLLHRTANAEAGEWILVHGAAGGVGTFLMDLARLDGINVIGTASPSKHALVTRFGGVPLDYRAPDLLDRILSISGGGVAAAFDHVGGRSFKRISMGALRRGGTGVVYGAYNMARGGKLNLAALADLMINKRFSTLPLMTHGRSVATYLVEAIIEGRAASYRRDLAHVFELVADGRISPSIGGVYSLAQANEAMDALQNRAVLGKLILVP